MPLTLTLTEGALPEGKETEAASQITEAFLRWHGLTDNRVMAPNVTNHIIILKKEHALSGGRPVVAAWIETRTPSFALVDRETQEGFFKDATDIIEAMSEGRLQRKDIHSDAVYAVDGSWNIDGKALTNENLLAAIANG